MKIENLNFSVRTYNILKRARIDTTEQLEQLSDDELMCVRNLGKHSLDEIHEKLESYTMTNGDRIRAMTDEELAEFLCGVYDEEETDKFICGTIIPNYFEEAICDWLKQPAEVDL